MKKVIQKRKIENINSKKNLTKNKRKRNNDERNTEKIISKLLLNVTARKLFLEK